MNRTSTWLFTLLAIEVAASPAAAQSIGFNIAPDLTGGWWSYECPAPASEAQCLDPAYQTSICGIEQIEAGACEYAAANALGSIATMRDGVAMNEQGDSLWGTWLPPQSTSGDYDYGFGASYLAELGQFAAEQRNPSLGSWVSWKAPATTRRAAWEGNGNAVASCEELAYEGWFTFSRFEDEAARRGTDARAVFDAARATSVGATHVRTRDGFPAVIGSSTAIPSLPFPKDKIPKNAYFLFEPSVFDAAIVPARLVPPADGRRYYNGDWAWHLAMDDTFRMWGYGTIGDDLMSAAHERQKKFVKLLERRARIIEALVAESLVRPVPVSPVVTAPAYTIGFEPSTAFEALGSIRDAAVLSPSSVSRVIAAETSMTSDASVVFTGGYTGNMARLWLVDQQIQAELSWAESQACLQSSWISVCDWSPEILADMIGEAYVKQREEEYQRCLQLTGNDFSDAAPIGNPSAFGVLPGNYRATAGMVRIFLNLFEASLAAEEYTPEPGSPGTPAIGWWRSSARWLGNDVFGAGYDYNFGFGLLPTDGVGECGIDFKIAARAGARALIAGTSQELLDSDTYGITEGTNSFKVHSHTRLLGRFELYTPIDRTYTTPEATTPWHLGKDWSTSALFWIGPVPVTAEIGVHGEAGVELAPSLSMTRACGGAGTIDITGGLTATPHIQANAFIAALVGAKGLGAGLRTDLQLARIAAPITVTGSFTGRGSDAVSLVDSMTGTVNVDLGLTVDSLGGSVRGVVETPIKTWHKTLFAWDGQRLVDEEWRRSWSFPMRIVRRQLGV